MTGRLCLRVCVVKQLRRPKLSRIDRNKGQLLNRLLGQWGRKVLTNGPIMRQLRRYWLWAQITSRSTSGWLFVTFNYDNYVVRNVFDCTSLVRLILKRHICICKLNKWASNTMCCAKWHNIVNKLLQIAACSSDPSPDTKKRRWHIHGTSYSLTVGFIDRKCDFGSQLRPAIHFDNINR